MDTQHRTRSFDSKNDYSLVIMNMKMQKTLQQRIMALGFVNGNIAPTDEVLQLVLECLPYEILDKIEFWIKLLHILTNLPFSPMFNEKSGTEL